jgi:hypothetical protein
MRFVRFWDIMQRRVVIMFRRFGTTYLSHIQRPRSQKYFLTAEYGTDILCRNVCGPTKLPTVRWVISQKNADLIYTEMKA